MANFDLGKRRAEQHREPNTLTLNDKVWPLPSILSGELVVALGQLANIQNDPSSISTSIEATYRQLFGENANEAMQLVGIDELGEVIGELYGITLGESLASQPS